MANKPLFTGSEWDFDLINNAMNALSDIAPELKLDTYPNQIEIITSEQMLDAYASVGLPVMYKHWSFGKKFSQESDMYKKGKRGLAYEIVLNTNPCINFLMEENTAMTQVLVCAHAAFGHNHVFKNNYLFKQWTDADSIVDYLNFSKNFIIECEEKYGTEKVERTLDAAHALMNHGVDRFKRPTKLSLDKEREKQAVRKEYLQQQINDLWKTVPKDKKEEVPDKKFLKQSEDNLLYFLEKKSPRLESWQREIIRIVRKIAQYFEPQRQCLTGNHMVSTCNGIFRLDQLIHRDGYIENDEISLLTDGNIYTPISHTYKNEAETLVVTTKSGRKFTATPEHPLQVLSKDKCSLEMCQISDMQVGNYLVYKLDYDPFSKNTTDIDYVKYSTELCKCEFCGLESENITSHLKQMHSKSISLTITKGNKEYISDIYRLRRSVNKIFKFPTSFNNVTSRLFGYLCNSYISEKNHRQSVIIFSTDNQDVANDFIYCLDEAFGICAVASSKPDFPGRIYVNFSSMMLKDLFYNNFEENRGNSQVPSIVFKFNKTCSANFIRAFFDSVNSSSAYERGAQKLRGYSADAVNFHNWQTLLIGHGVMMSLKTNTRESYQSMCYTLSITGCTDVKACDYSLTIANGFIHSYNNNIGTSRKLFCEPINASINRIIPGMKSKIIEVKAILKSQLEDFLLQRGPTNMNYAYKKKHNLCVGDTGLVISNLLPRISVNNEVTYNEIIKCINRHDILSKLENIKHRAKEFEELWMMMKNCLSNHYDEIISIEQGSKTTVYDVTVPYNHLFWCDGIISHNTKVLNEGWATFTHYYMMNRLWEKGFLTDGAMLEFYQMHTSVVQQPAFDSQWYSGFNPYYVGFEIFNDIRRICTEPTEEDKEYFPDIVGKDWVDVCIDAVANYRDESFIRQFLSPHLCRKMKLFMLSDDNKSDYTVEAIHDAAGFKKIRKTFANSYLSEQHIPKIEVIDVDYNTRKLTLMYQQKDNRDLSKKAAKVIKHIEDLWGFPVELIDENGTQIPL